MGFGRACFFNHWIGFCHPRHRNLESTTWGNPVPLGQPLEKGRGCWGKMQMLGKTHWSLWGRGVRSFFFKLANLSLAMPPRRIQVELVWKLLKCSKQIGIEIKHTWKERWDITATLLVDTLKKKGVSKLYYEVNVSDFKKIRLQHLHMVWSQKHDNKSVKPFFSKTIKVVWKKNVHNLPTTPPKRCYPPWN